MIRRLSHPALLALLATLPHSGIDSIYNSEGKSMGMSKQTSKAPLKSPIGFENQASLLQHVAGIRIHLDEIRVHLALTSTPWCFWVGILQFLLSRLSCKEWTTIGMSWKDMERLTNNWKIRRWSVLNLACYLAWKRESQRAIIIPPMRKIETRFETTNGIVPFVLLNIPRSWWLRLDPAVSGPDPLVLADQSASKDMCHTSYSNCFSNHLQSSPKKWWCITVYHLRNWSKRKNIRQKKNHQNGEMIYEMACLQ